jgi:phosphoserine phosphatase RsbU/P
MTPPEPAFEIRFEQLRKLTEISRALTYTTSPDEVLPLATVRAAELLQARSALIMLTDEEGLLRVRATHGVHDEALLRFREPLDESVMQRLQHLLDTPSPEAFLGVPLVVSGGVIGLLAVVRAEGKLITDEEEWLLSAIADQVAVALENVRLEEQLRQQRAPAASRSSDAQSTPRDSAPPEEGSSDRALATLSHDLRSPLNAIDSYAELIEMEILGPVSDRQREALGRIRMSGRHLLAVLENVLEMARISADAIHVQASPVTVRTVMEEAALMVRPTATAKQQALEVRAPDEMMVDADPNRLRQVLVNLLNNAVKYTQETGTIRVDAAVLDVEGERWGAISVIDNGPGIPEDKLQSIFHPYFRIPASEEEGPEGTGLGLAISRELVRRMGGEVEVESEYGSGCTFVVRLPLS